MLKHFFFMMPFLLCLIACEEQPDVTKTTTPTDAIQKEIKKVSVPAVRSWDEIKASGYIKALKLDREQEAALPRSGSTSIYHQQLLSIFAEENELEVQWVSVKNLKEMFEQLEQFNADIIPRHLTITKEREQRFSFTYPLLRDKEVLIGNINAKIPSNSDEITLHLPRDSSYIESVKKYFPQWKIVPLKKAFNSEQLSDEIVQGNIDFTIIDGFAFNTLEQYRSDIKVLLTMPDNIDLAWITNLNNPSLLFQLNNFISVHHVLQTTEPDRKLDIHILKKEKLPLRVITRNSPETYFLWRGELLGFEYELMRRFASLQNLKLEMIVANSYEEMLAMLEDGRGDMIAAGLSRTQQRSEVIKQRNLQTSIRYNRVSEQLIAHKDSPKITTLNDLKGRKISVRRTSSFWQTANELATKYGAIIVEADESLATEILIYKIAEKEIDLTIADSNLVAIEMNFRDDIISPLTLKESIPYAYITRNNNPKLLAHLNQFIRTHYRNTFYNVVKNKYFSNAKNQTRLRENRIQTGSNLSPYDDLVRDNASDYQFDWRLIVSQMYQESRFDPNASNPTGAKGLMQMLPRTAAELGVTDLTEPEQAISSGVRYLNWTRERFSKELPVQEQIFFSLASYNAGYGHVKDAQRLAKQMGLRHDKWFNHVEKAMLLLQKKQYYKNARFGYVRGSEPVNYVRNIHQRYLSYIKITQ